MARQSRSDNSSSVRLNYRSVHRMRAHQQAHAQTDDSFPPVLDHPMVPAQAPKMISSQSELDHLLDTLRQAGCFAYDSEFIGEHTFYPRFCVIQVATKTQITLIDALADLDLQPFWELMADPRVLKLVHAGAQDLEPVWRHVNKPPANVIDIQVAAGFIGMTYPTSLAGLVQQLLDAQLRPGAKFSQWDHRPLSSVQRRYAADDVRYLPLLWKTVRSRLVELGNLDLALQACADLCEPANFQIDPANQRLRVRGLETLSRRKTAILRALVVWRTGLAQQQDLPPRVLMDDGVLMTLARLVPRDRQQVHAVRGLPRPIKQQHTDEILEIIQQASQAPLPRMTLQLGPPTDEEKAVIQSAHTALVDLCEQRRIAPNLVASKKLLGRLIRRGLDKHDPATAHLITGWRQSLIAPVLTEQTV